MQIKHHSVPWFGASEELQASLALTSVSVAVQEASTDSPVTPAQPAPIPFASFVTPLPTPPPLPKEAPPPEDTLPYMTEEDTDPSQSSTSDKGACADPEQESQEDPEEQPKPRPPTPSDEDVALASKFSPSNLRQWDYAISHHSNIMIRYPKGTDSSASLLAALIKQDLPSEESDDLPSAKRLKTKVPKLKVWPKKDPGSSILYHAPKPDDDDDAPPSMV